MSKLQGKEKRRRAALARWYKKMAWYGKHPVARHRAQLERLGVLMNLYKQDLATRLAETRKLFGRPVCLVDIHTHTLHSDGLGTVAENAERIRFCGLDFFFPLRFILSQSIDRNYFTAGLARILHTPV